MLALAMPACSPPSLASSAAHPTRATLGLLLLLLLLLCTPTPARADDRFEWLAGRLLHDPSYKVRVQAAISLGRRDDPEAREALVRALDDPEAAVRAVAAISLGKMGGAGERGALEEAARDPEPLVAASARRALEQLTERVGEGAAAAEPERVEASGAGLATMRHPGDLARLQDRINPLFASCLIRHLRRDPRFSGLSVRLTVAPGGTLEDLELLRLARPSKPLEECMQAALDEVVLPPAGGGPVTISWPLEVSR